MRLWLALAALCAASLATIPVENPILEVFNSWHPDRPLRILEHDEGHEEQGEEVHHRSKRSIPVGHNAYIAPSKGCQTPGYTGEFCEFPICYEVNNNVPDVPNIDGQGAWVDGAQLANCTQQYIVLVDESMDNIRIQLQAANNVNPRFSLRGPDGSTSQPDAVLTQTITQYEALFFSLTPGQYLIIPSADVQNTFCNMQMQARTALTVVGGFNQGNGYSTERSDFPMANAISGSPSTLVVHANQNRSPGKLVAVNFVGGSNTLYRPRLLSTRYGCGYEFYFENFNCDTPGSWYVQVEGQTFYGWGFRRIIPFTCFPAPPPTTTTPAPSPSPTTSAALFCANNGMMITNSDNSQYCYCTGLFTGPQCQQKLCLNGGTLDGPSNNCLCPDSYSGDHCQDIQCIDSAGVGFDAEHPSLIFVVRTRQQLSDVIGQVMNATQQVVNSLSFDPTYINSYIVVLFNGNQLSLVERYTSFNDVLTALTMAQNTNDTSGGCTDSVFSAINAALGLYPNNNSPMYVITDATPGDETEYQTALSLLSFWRVPLNILFIPPGPNCIISPDDKGFRTLDDLAKKSSGMVFTMFNRTNTQAMLYNHMYQTVYRTQLMLSNDLAICSNENTFQSVTVDSTVNQIVIVATGTEDLRVIVTMPEGNRYNAMNVYNDGANYIWTINGPHIGNWFFTFIGMKQPNGPCNFKVFQKGYHNPGPRQAQYDLFWALTGAIDGDGELVQPLYGFDNAITAHLTNYPYQNQIEVNAGLSIYASRNGVQTQVYASNGLWRDKCTFNFYFPPFTCQVPGETLYFNFYAQDSIGMSIQRAGVMSCMQFTPTQNPPTSCQNGGVMNPANTTCFCPPPWNGTFCQNINCFNGGTPNGNQCSCPIGWTGQFCELAKCLQQGPNPETMLSGVNMLFFVEITQQGISQIATLNKVFADLLRDVQSQNSQWISQFVLVGYNSTWSDVLALAPSSNPSSVVNALNTLSSTLPTDPGCNDVQLYQALDHAVYLGLVPAGSYAQIFQMSPADQGQSRGWSRAYTYSRDLNLVINGFLGYSPRNPNGFYCGAQQSNFTLLFDLVGGSNGGVAIPTQPGHISDLVRIIPSQYSSGIVFAQYAQDCNSPMQMYFPVDAYTQTIQLTVVGLSNRITLVDSNGKVQTPIDIVHDTFSNYDIYEYRKPCDDLWTPSGQYCIRFEASLQYSFADAQAFCANSGGYLVDDLSDAKHNFLITSSNGFKFWLGLANNGRGWNWDRGNNAPVPLTQTQQWWVNGTAAPAYNPNKGCAFFDSSQRDGNTWTPDNCGTKRAFICQKHRYDQKNTPNQIGDDVLPAGKWYVNVTSSNNATANIFGCQAQVRVQSSLQIVTGFTTSMTNDIRGGDPTQDNPNNMLMTYIHSEDNEHRTPILFHSLIWDPYNGTFYNAAAYQYRVECSYPWYSQTFSCPAEDMEIGITHIGEDQFGNTFQRVTFGHCIAPVLTCGNGGIRSNGQCICDEYWTGEYCTVPICVNNGTLDSTETRCNCPPTFAGFNCQYDMCSTHTPYSVSPNGKTLIVVIEGTQQNMVAINQIRSNFNSIVQNALGQNPGWFTNYILTTFNTAGAATLAGFTSPVALQTALGIYALTITDPGNCTTGIFSALQFTLRQQDLYNVPNSQILLVTSSGAADYGMRKETEQQISNAEARLHWLYMTSPTCGPMPSDPSAPHLEALSYITDGNVVFLNSSTLANFLTAYLPTLYQAATLTSPTLGTNFTCSGDPWFVQIDRSTTTIYVTATSQFGSIGVLDPTGQMRQASVMYNVGQTKLYSIDTTGVPGIYKISLSSPGQCFANVYAVGGVVINNYYTLAPASDPLGIHTDGNSQDPQVGATNVAVFHSDSSRLVKLGYVVILDFSTGTVLLRSELHRRFGCTFEFYSDPFTCGVNALMVYVHGIDEYNQEFRRQEFANCINGTLPTNPPITSSPAAMSTTPRATSAMPQTTQPAATSPTTQPAVTSPTMPPMTTPTTPAPTTSFGNLNLMFDVVFLVDVSSSASATYDDMSKFISTLMLSYTVSLDYVRIGLIPVFGDSSYGPMTIASFNSISSQVSLNNYLNQMKNNYADFGDNGQYLNQALGAAMNPSYISTDNGYRASINNHLLVYVTSANSFSDQPSTASILSSNTYGVITIGYKSGLSPTDLANLAGGASCAFTAANFADLNGSVLPAVKSAIWNAYMNNGKYCGNGN